MNTKFFGPYLRDRKNGKWHWIKSCSQFPQDVKSESMISSSKPAAKFLCEECMDREKKGISIMVPPPNKTI